MGMDDGMPFLQTLANTLGLKVIFVFAALISMQRGALTGAERHAPAIAERPARPVVRVSPDDELIGPIPSEEELTAEQERQIRLLENATNVWFFVVGATLGSFLNVVVHRLPLGMSLRRPKSRCPICEMPIRRGDNLPMIGWLRLRGRCRSCGTRVSFRYPAVEAGVGLLFLALLHVELLSGGGNLPFRSPNSYANVVWIIWYTKWDLIGLYCYHAFLLCSVLVMALIRFDGSRVPRRFLLGINIAAVIFAVNWPHLHPVPFEVPVPDCLEAWRWSLSIRDSVFSGWDQKILGVSLRGFLDGGIGLLAGAGIGWGVQSIDFLPPSASRSQRRAGQSAELPLVMGFLGAILGWQGFISVCCLAALVLILFRICRFDDSSGSFLAIGMAATVQIFFWRSLSEIPHWPGHQSTFTEMTLAVVLSFCLFAIGKYRLNSERTNKKPPE